MPTVSEMLQGVAGTQNNRSIQYLVTDAADDNDALNAVENDSPLFYDGMPRDDIQIQEISQKDGMYQAVAMYRRGSGRKQQATGSTPVAGTSKKGLFAFETSLETMRMRYPIAVMPDGSSVKSYVPPGEFVVPRDTIGPADDEGMDIPWPRTRFTMDYYPPDADVTEAYLNFVTVMVGSVNHAPFHGYSAGRVLFSGARGESRNEEDWRFSFSFDVAPRLKYPLEVGEIVVPPEEHDDLPWWSEAWVDYEEEIYIEGGGFNFKTREFAAQLNIFNLYPAVDLDQLFQPVT